MADNTPTQSVKNGFPNQSNGTLFDRRNAAVRQDRDRIASDLIASPQPASVTLGDRSQGTNPKRTRSTPPLVHKSRTEHLNVWINPRAKSQLQQLAAEDGLSLSATTAAFLERSLQEHVDLQTVLSLSRLLQARSAKSCRGRGTGLPGFWHETSLPLNIPET
jgi:hypothetical protein